MVEFTTNSLECLAEGVNAYKKVAQSAILYQEENEYQKYWFDRFAQHESNVEAWAAFQLFIKCVNHGSILWLSDKLNNMKKYLWNKERFAFMGINKSDINNARSKNTEALKDTLLYQKISSKELSPWLFSEVFE